MNLNPTAVHGRTDSNPLQLGERSDLSPGHARPSAPDQEGLHPGGLGPLNIFLLLVADVKDFFRGQLKLRGRLEKNRRRRFEVADLVRDHNRLKEPVQTKLAQKRTQPLVPIGNHRQLQSPVPQRAQCQHDIVENPPGRAAGEAIVNLAKKRPARRDLGQAGEGLVHQLLPRRGGVIEVFPAAPGGGEIDVERFHRKPFQTVLGRNRCIDVAHGWPGLDQRSPNVKRHRLDFPEGFHPSASVGAVLMAAAWVQSFKSRSPGSARSEICNAASASPTRYSEPVMTTNESAAARPSASDSVAQTDTSARGLASRPTAANSRGDALRSLPTGASSSLAVSGASRVKIERQFLSRSVPTIKVGLAPEKFCFRASANASAPAGLWAPSSRKIWPLGRPITCKRPGHRTPARPRSHCASSTGMIVASARTVAS